MTDKDKIIEIIKDRIARYKEHQERVHYDCEYDRCLLGAEYALQDLIDTIETDKEF